MTKKSSFNDPMGHHIRLYSQIYDSPAYKALSPTDVMAYLALRRDLKSTNNGDLSLTLTKSKERGICHHITLARSLRALCAVGLIYQTRKGGATRGGQRLPSLYAVTDVDVFALPKKHIEAQKASNAWRKVTSAEEGRAMIAKAEINAKKISEKLKNQGHEMTMTTTSDDALTPNIGTPIDIWTDPSRHSVTYGENAGNRANMRAPECFSSEGEFVTHRTPDVSPIHIATPSGLIVACTEGVEANFSQPVSIHG
jgi:hypothetical protein